jgi:hypothetical protein
MIDITKYSGEKLSDEFYEIIKKGYKKTVIHLLEYDYEFELIVSNENDVLIKIYGICVIEFYKGDITVFDI